MHVDAKITAKNQTTVPAEIRDRLGLRAGDRLRYTIGDDGRITVGKVSGSLDSLRGLVDLGRDVSTDEIVEAVDMARAEIGRHGRDGSAGPGAE